MARVTPEDVLRLAMVAEADGDRDLATALYAVGGRAGRLPTGRFDPDEREAAAVARGLVRARQVLEADGADAVGADAAGWAFDPATDPAPAAAPFAAPAGDPVTVPDLPPSWPPPRDCMRAPFPWFGGKSRAAHLIWERFGDVPNYVEPFAGSLATLLKRPHPPRTETVNDIDCLVANFWRAVRADPDAVAAWAAMPVDEANLHAVHLWLVRRVEFRERMKCDVDYYDARVAGWWVWGLSSWIAGGWCQAAARDDAGVHRPIPHLSGTGQGVHRKMPSTRLMGVHRKMPNLGGGAVGVHRSMPDPVDLLPDPADLAGIKRSMPNLFGDHGVHRKLPELGASRGVARKLPNLGGWQVGVGGTSMAGDDAGLVWYFRALADRFRRVRVCCGSWERVLGPSVTVKHGLTGVLLDPPYADTSERNGEVYSHDDMQVAHEVRRWAIANGGDPLLRVALCCYESEHEMPADWHMVEWKASGGYGNQRRDGSNENAARERIWFSPHCLRPDLARGRQATFGDAFPDAEED